MATKTITSRISAFFHTTYAILAKIFLTVWYVLILCIAFCLGILLAVTSLVWMPLLMYASPSKAAKLLYGRPNKDGFMYLVQEASLWLIDLMGCMWHRLAMSWLGTKKMRYYFIRENVKSEPSILCRYKTSHQVEFWLSTAGKIYELLKHMSDDAIIQVFNKASIKEKKGFIETLGLRPEFIKTLLIGSYDELNLLYAKGNELNNQNQLASILPDCIKAINMLEGLKRLKAWSNLGDFIKAFGFDKFRCKKGDEINALWSSGNENCRMLVILEDGINISRLLSMVNSNQYAMLQKVLCCKTLSAEQVEWLINEVKHNKKLESILIEHITLQGLHINTLQKVYKENHPLKDKIQRAVDIHQETILIKGYTDRSEENNLALWKTYILQNKKVFPETQMKMKKEHFIIFSEAGLKLDNEALEHLMVNVNRADYFSILLEKEWSSLTPLLVSLIKATPWKYGCYIEEKEKHVN